MGYGKTRLGKQIGNKEAAGVDARLLYGYLADAVFFVTGEVRVEPSGKVTILATGPLANLAASDQSAMPWRAGRTR